MLEMCLLVAMVLQRFDVELLPDQAILPKAALTLRPSAPVRVVLRRGSPNQVACCQVVIFEAHWGWNGVRFLSTP
jgi:hypothetical protein